MFEHVYILLSVQCGYYTTSKSGRAAVFLMPGTWIIRITDVGVLIIMTSWKIRDGREVKNQLLDLSLCLWGR